MKKVMTGLAAAIALSTSVGVMADTIDPVAYADTLAVGESVTIRKTVVIDDAAPSSGLIDVMFLMDTSGSMNDEINQAKAAINDIISGLGGFGDVATGVGYFSEPGSDGVVSDLSTNGADTSAALAGIYLGLGGGGGDFPEEGIHATYEAATEASWRPGSTRFVIALSDATFKESDGATLAGTTAALLDENITFIGIDYGSMTSGPGIHADILSDATGGSIIKSSGLSTSDLVDDITAGVTAAYSEYTTVTVDDLGAGMPGVDVTVACVSADTGVCVGADAVGTYDRSVERTFTYDVTFTALEEGVHAFDTLALVDGGRVAAEADTITVVTEVTEPATLALFGLGLAGLMTSRRRKA
jgi:hypothetical protein